MGKLKAASALNPP